MTLELGSAVSALGRLVGLLTGKADDVALNTGWFQDPLGALRKTGTRLNCLADLAASVLGPPEGTPPEVFSGAQWYGLPNPLLGTPTPLRLVTGRPGEAAGQLGAGVLDRVQLGELTIEAFAYVPFVSYGDPAHGGDAAPLLGTADGPVQLRLRASSAEVFGVDGVTFSAMQLDARVYLAAEDPSFTLAFEGLTGTDKPAQYDRLADLLDPDVLEWIGEAVVQAGPWLSMAVAGEVSLGDLLVGGGLLSQDGEGDYEVALSGLRGKTPQQIVLDLFFGALGGLATLDFPLVPLPGGGVYVAHETDGDDDRYGVRVVAEVSIGGGPSDGGGGPAPTAVDLCLGSWFTGEIDSTSWMRQTTGTAYAPGLSLLLLRRTADGDLSFDPDFALTSLGVNVRGGAGAPLVSVDGVTLAGAELRLFLESTGWQFGFGARLDSIGFPLGQDFAAVPTTGNPVAQNLLASGSDPAQGGEANAVNPPFSAEVAYVLGHKPLLEVVDADGKPSDVLWIPVQRRLGPLSCRRVGVRLDDSDEPLLSVLFDGSVAVGGLDIDLDELSVGVRLDELTDPSHYQLDVQGLDIDFSAAGVTIGAGLRKVSVEGGIEYDGDAILQLEDLAIHALGSYANLPAVGTSLFVFALLNAPIGGPACLFVTGLAGGFGYNRRLRIPTLSEVQGFPLVAGLTQPSVLGGTSPTTGAVLATLSSWVAPQRGEYWLAAGVQFTTYEIINTNVLLMVEFGNDFTVAAVGASVLKQPQSGFTWVYAELDIEAVFQPLRGEVRASAVLAPNSYVLTRDAHLTGGFAFAAWFGASPHAGDFVLTLGGYHPAFTPPSYYPTVAPVGINWQLDSRTAMVGGAYFALTPVAMMAGANVAVTFSAGPLRAWLKANANGILFWKPFYLIASVSVSVGVEFHLQILFVDVTISVELGADFEIWGPPIGFRAHVDWYIVSFTIGSGEPDPPSAISWEDFKAMLPSKPPVSNPSPIAEGADVGIAGTDGSSTPAVLTITVANGLTRSHTVGDRTLWLVRPRAFRMQVTSAVPASEVVILSEPGSNITVAGLPAAMRTVNGGISPADYRSTQTIAILRLQSNNPAHIAECMAAGCAVRPPSCGDPLADMAGWEIEALEQPLPQALWGEPIGGGNSADVNGPQPTIEATVGVTAHPKPPAITNCTPEVNVDAVFADRIVNADEAYRLPLSPADQPCPDVPRRADTFSALAAVNDQPAATARAALFQALRELGINGWTDDPLPRMAATPGLDFADEPLQGQPVCTGQ